MTRRLMEATTAALELFAVHLGSTLGLYDALDRHGPMTPHDLAELTDINERYAREWLEQQAVAGFVSLADGRFALPAEYRGALLDPVDGDHVAPFATMVVGIAAVLDDVAEAYRTGGGVEYAKYGAHFRKGQGAINRPAFSTDLVQSWLPAIDGVTERLAAGAAWSTSGPASAGPLSP